MLYSPTSLLMFTANKGKYTIHGSYGKISSKFSRQVQRSRYRPAAADWTHWPPPGAKVDQAVNPPQVWRIQICTYIYINIKRCRWCSIQSNYARYIHLYRKTDLQEKKKWQLEIITLSPGHLAPYITGAHWWPSLSWNTAPQTQSKVPCCTSCT